MSAIGGIADFKNDEVDFVHLNKMRLSMSMRGRERSSAFVCGGVGMFFNESQRKTDSSESERQPYICERKGSIHALCMDCENINYGAVMESYLIHGTDFLGLINGAFALAIYDAERDMLILARDRKGKKPLFYRMHNNKVYFSSEVKGILDGIDARASVNREILQTHLTSSMGVYRVSNIYPDISEVRAGECLIFTGIGISNFFYRERRDIRAIKGSRNALGKDRVICSYPNYNISNLNDYLSEALIAFDYPQFDCFMPSVIELLERSHRCGAESVVFEDAIRRKNISYAIEREDRLGSLFGIDTRGVNSNTASSEYIEYAQKAAKQLSQKLFCANDTQIEILKSVFGEYKLYAIFKMLEQKVQKSEDTEVSVRILGMMCQTVEWIEMRNPILCESRKVCPQFI